MFGYFWRVGVVMLCAFGPMAISVLEYYAESWGLSILLITILFVLFTGIVLIVLLVRLIVIPFRYGLREPGKFLVPTAMLCAIGVAIFFWGELVLVPDRVFFWLNQDRFEKMALGTVVVHRKSWDHSSLLFMHDATGQVREGPLDNEQIRAIEHAIGELYSCSVSAKPLGHSFFIIRWTC